MNAKEEWRDVPNYEGYYQVSSLGRVKGLDRKVRHSDSGLKVKKGKLFKVLENKQGYLFVNLSLEGSIKKFYIHQLVAMAWLGHTPCGHEVVVDHIDNNKTNNKPSNLQLTSSRENASKDKVGGSSKYIGVNWNKRQNKWNAKITINGKCKHLGYFSDELEAAKYYQMALESIESGTEIKVKLQPTSSKYKGVTWNKKNKRWRTNVTINNKSKHIGLFDDEYEAHLAYQKALEELNTKNIK